MRMPYIGGRGPDYTTKLNLMYNWQADGKLEGSRGKTPGPVESEAGKGGDARDGVAGRRPFGWRVLAEEDAVR